jgi:peptidoglycan/xylan/chitin deacetylase (PgdA/CDA1 family)
MERIYAGSYKNIVQIRDNKGLTGTFPLFSPPVQEYEPFPEKESPVNLLNFTHGSRIRRREVAVVFNAIDSVEGLTDILNTLSEYEIRATFFVNGEFIRRHPDAVREIASSGHEVGSMFYTYFDMTDSRFTIDKEFIKRGLARNEDDYFFVTGKEVSVLWHAPYYFVNTEIIDASREMNYTYVGRDIDALDWVTDEVAGGVRGGLYYPSAVLVERIIAQKKPGSIIPIRIGKAKGEREDYLFHKLDLLLNGLISLGYTIVPVSTLIEHAR